MKIVVYVSLVISSILIGLFFSNTGYASDDNKSKVGISFSEVEVDNGNSNKEILEKTTHNQIKKAENKKNLNLPSTMEAKYKYHNLLSLVLILLSIMLKGLTQRSEPLKKDRT
ncbi:hypothetical protein CKN73_02830 [Carnobacterium divergens]|uniref:hypothetical protein n=1 Tax=Carnobacterium divergens TaxID=2748 RepID=UPI001071A94F|nr:hypothetical protein [Carnobacterium divergens]TFJ43589.1 hypothetical protein CKN77_02760 [Carnobacterium divergens]TFJ51419.1 hypothetical protein CKN73_02830 [Carnobacterium divergens]TFJ56409.1 hypothetical protein CKN83_02775 [Carnobacterium divergens]TFJ64049.1 hypothetical protein CKN89_02855 [Carnobacterium divergens]TFJ73368.1 hypothetical protein CKN91_02775 [Carnobacterium divergens]